MRLSISSVITTGVTASVVVVLFLLVIPKLIGLGAMDITRQLGLAFSVQSPHVAGAVFMAIAGIIWAAIFSVVYNALPGGYFLKGLVFGLIVGLFSLLIQPNLMVSLANTFGQSASQYTPSHFNWSMPVLVTLIGYVIFGLTLSWSYRPAGR